LEELKQNEIKLLCEHESDIKDMQAMRGHNILQNAIEIVKAGGIEQGNKDYDVQNIFKGEK